MQPVTNHGSWCWTWLGKKGSLKEKREQHSRRDKNVLSTSGLKTKNSQSKTSPKDCQHFSPKDEGWRFPRACTTRRTSAPQLQAVSVGSSNTLVTEGVGWKRWLGTNHIAGITQAVLLLFWVLRCVSIPSCSPASVQLLFNHFCEQIFAKRNVWLILQNYKSMKKKRRETEPLNQLPHE